MSFVIRQTTINGWHILIELTRAYDQMAYRVTACPLVMDCIYGGPDFDNYYATEKQAKRAFYYCVRKYKGV